MLRVHPSPIVKPRSSLRSVATWRGARLAFVAVLAVLMLGVWLVALNGVSRAGPALAPEAASETRLSQCIQNSWGSRSCSSSSPVTGTYGELFTVTLRFTITADTVLTGPVSLQAGFNSITTTAAYSNRLGLRFLGYQGPYTSTDGTPPLTVTVFSSDPTRLIGGRPSTYLTWTFDTITNPTGSGITYTYELSYQVSLAWDGQKDIDVSALILGSPDTKLIWQGGGTPSPQPPGPLTVNLQRPNLDAPYSTKTSARPSGLYGGAPIIYNVTLKNGSSATGFTTAYDLVVTDTLDSRLTGISASPAASISGNVLTWTLSPLAPNTTWVARITATLPITFAANEFFTNTVTADYSTQPGSAPDDGSFTSLIGLTPKSDQGGVTASKQVRPTSVKIGDSVVYTVSVTLLPGVYMNTPIFTDTLPDGFHWISGTFTLSGDATLSGLPFTGTSGVKESLIWQIQNWAGGTTRTMTVTYAAMLTGLRTDGSVAWPSLGSQSAINSVTAAWTDSSGNKLVLVSPAQATTTVIQPNLYGTNGNNLSKTGPVWGTDAEELGALAKYTVKIVNSAGSSTAYDVVLTDTLPPGMTYYARVGFTGPAGSHLVAEPSQGASGNVSFEIDQLPYDPAGATIEFQALVTDQARPGDTLTNTVKVTDYTSQPGTGNPYDRHYNDTRIPNALPIKPSAGFVVKGLTATKTDAPDRVQPGQTLTYSIIYSNTSANTAATNAYITDTYDANLTNPAWSSSPDIGDPTHDSVARTLTWGPLNLPVNTLNRRITATFQVNTSVSRSVRVLSNTITSDWDSPAPAVSRLVTTTLTQPMPEITLDDKGITVTAGSLLTYTMTYSNAPAGTGATTSTFTITLNYPPEYLSFKTPPTGCGAIKCYFVNAGAGAVVFTGTLGTVGASISSTVNLVMTVTRPLPYWLNVITSTATIMDRVLGADASASDDESTPVALPRFDMAKWRAGGAALVYDGAPIVYNFAITNTGSVVATNIVITDVWDVNAPPAGTIDPWVPIAGGAVYTVPSLAPGASTTLLALSVQAANPLPPEAQQIVNTMRLSSRDTTEQGITYDLLVVGINMRKYADPSPVFPGDTLVYTIAYRLDSDFPAGASQITDSLPSQVTYVSCDVDNVSGPYFGTCGFDAGNNVVNWTWAGLPLHASGVVTVTVQAPTTEWVTLVNHYSSASDGTPYRTGPAVATYVGRPHLSLSKAASTAVTPIAPGDLITYTITYVNSGSYQSTNTQVHDTLPANTIYVSCLGAPCSESGGLVTWSLGDVPVTTTGYVTMVVQVDPAAGSTTIVNNTYSIQADRNVAHENTPNSVSTQVQQPQLVVVKTASPAWVNIGDSILYTVRYTNTGGGILTTLLFTDALDSRTDLQSASANCSNPSAGAVTCGGNPLSPLGTGVFTISVKVNSGAHNNDVLTNAVTYLFDHQPTSGLPVQGTTTPVEVPVSAVGAAADFVGSPLSGTVPLTVTFTNESSGTGIVGCLWSFGDGGMSTSCAATVQHTYNVSGVYTVTLTVTTGSGTHMRTRPSYVTATPGAVVVWGVTLTPSADAKSGLVGKVVTYTLTIQNTGNQDDSFNVTLTLSGNPWPTTLSANPVGPLSPNGTGTVSVYVTVPSSAADGATDVVAVMATSQGDSSKIATSNLTTTAARYKVYLPVVLKK